MTVESTNNPSNLAYTSGRLTLHVDLSTVNYSPEVSKNKHSPSLYDKLNSVLPMQFQMFHCIRQVSGSHAGSGWYCDGFAAAHHLKREFPESFRILSEYDCYNRDVGSDYVDFDNIFWRPVFK